jgi:AraC-like DNA-binding protein
LKNLNNMMKLDAHPHNVISEYREFPVPASMANHFLCFWKQVIVGSGEYTHRVLPDACIDIVFINEGPPVVVGPWTSPFVVRLPAGTNILGARLHPGLGFTVLGIPATELLNQSAPLYEVLSTNSTRFSLPLDEPTLVSQVSALAEALARATAFATSPDGAVVASIQWLARRPHATVEQLSQSIGISHRQLQRRFSAAVGYGPKMFQSVLRFQRLLNFATKPATPLSLADLAAVAGYTDQAHMTREVRRFAGCTPTALMPSAACTLRMSDLFKTDHPASY